MYIPAANRIDDPAKIHSFIHAYAFATVVTQNGGTPWGSHLPVLLEECDRAATILRSHMARANEQWKHFEPNREVLCIFHGPHAYISPAWYVQQHTVPTWNYAAVHVYGYPTIVDSAALRKIVVDTTENYETKMPQPWRLPLSDSEMNAMLKAIVGFTIAITRIEAKFKLSQNLSKADQEGAVRGLQNSGDPLNLELAKFTRAHSNLDGARFASQDAVDKPEPPPGP